MSFECFLMAGEYLQRMQVYVSLQAQNLVDDTSVWEFSSRYSYGNADVVVGSEGGVCSAR